MKKQKKITSQLGKLLLVLLMIFSQINAPIIALAEEIETQTPTEEKENTTEENKENETDKEEQNTPEEESQENNEKENNTDESTPETSNTNE